MSKNPPPHLLTIEDVADLNRVSAKTARRWIKAKELPAAKLGGQWCIHPKDVERFFAERLSR